MSLPKQFKQFKQLLVTKPSADFRGAATLVTTDMPQPGEGEVLIRNIYVGINASDPISSAGGYGQSTPFTLGLDSGGEVIAVGAGVENVKVGDQVLAFAFGGAFAEYRQVASTYVFPVPEITPEVMSAFIPALTASLVCYETHALKNNETVLVTAAAGGVGSYVVQLAKLGGNHVIGTCSDDAKGEWLKTLGCDRVINYKKEDLDAVLTEEYPQGINAVFENVGRQTFDTALKHLAVFGRLVSIGAVSEYGEGTEWEVVEGVRVYQALLAKSATMTALMLAICPPDVWLKHFDIVSKLLSENKLTVTLDATEFVGLESVADAVEHMQTGKNRGKVLVRL